MITPDLVHYPGRIGVVETLVACNAKGGRDGSWYVRTGTSMYPDYAHPDFGGGYTGGRLLTPDQADEYANHLRRCAAWARAQRILEGETS